MKPTIGIVSPDGVVPVSKFCDSPGPLARTAKDLAILMDVLVDSSTTKVPEGGYLSKVTGDWQGLKIGTLPLRVRDGIGKGEIWKQVSEQQVRDIQA
jgi:amidase